MFARARMVALATCACLAGMVSIADADIVLVKQKLADFKSASTELHKLFVAVKDGALVTSGAEQIQRAIERRDSADKALSEAIQETMKTLDQSNQRDGEALEKIFDEVQKINKTVTDDQLRYTENQALARARAAAAAAAAAKKK